MEIRELKDTIDCFDKVRILVVGDMMLDQFIQATVSRISPEAPVPIAEVVSEVFKPGGTANTINNIRSLGGSIIPVGIIGDDAEGKKLINLITDKEMDKDCVLVDSSRPTTVKTRIVADGQQIVRVDREKTESIDYKHTRKIVDFVKENIDYINAIVISDYDKGVITGKLLENLIPLAKKYNKPVIADPKVAHFLDYKGVRVVTPNVKEASIATGTRFINETSVINMGQWILTRVDCDAVLITRGKDGMSLFEKEGKVTHIPAIAKEVYDVTGAGDTVTSVVALALAAGTDMLQAAILANSAASVVVSKIGTATLTRDELKNQIDKAKEKILRPNIRVIA